MRNTKKAETEDTAVTLQIPPLDRWLMKVKIVGTTPLLVNNFSKKTIDTLVGTVTGNRPPRTDRIPEEEFKSARHSPFGDDKDYFPVTGVKKSIITAGSRFMDDQTSVYLWGSFFIDGEYVEIQCPGKKPKDWPRMRMDIRRLSGISKAPDPVWRPEYTPWEMNIQIRYTANFISKEELVRMIEMAGQSVGIGGWRVEKKGQFGTFEIGAMQFQKLPAVRF